MRKHADWMVIVDERILEFIDEQGNHQPAQITAELGAAGGGMNYHEKYVGRRCRKLADYGLLRNIGNGVYKLTETGVQYLAGKVDASELEEEEG